MKTFKIRIFGRVQGVGFRFSAQREAEKNQLSGWVKNEPDGTVTVEVTGAEADLNAFKNWCNIGPPSARVDKIHIEETTTEQESGFKVVY